MSGKGRREVMRGGGGKCESGGKRGSGRQREGKFGEGMREVVEGQKGGTEAEGKWRRKGKR